MKKIVLIGDSIRMGYDKYVKDALKNSAEVYYPEDNCRFAEYVLRYAHEWKEKFCCKDDVDLVHFNAGLWDCLEAFDGEPHSTLDFYEYEIERVALRLRMLFPEAKLVFATSTPVIEEKCAPNFKRHNSTIEKFNEAAKGVMKKHGVIINDLYILAQSFPEKYHSDAVHFYTPEGTEAIGGKVLSVICNELGISADEVDIEGFKPEQYSKDTIGF